MNVLEREIAIQAIKLRLGRRREQQQQHVLLSVCHRVYPQLTSDCRLFLQVAYQSPEIDAELLLWVKRQNHLGLSVKDKYVTAKAIGIADCLGVSNFGASRGYLHKFKNRHSLVSRAPTTRRTLPEDASDQTLTFIKINNLVRQHDILLKNILNFDQVPRYFDAHWTKTITVRRLKLVCMTKALARYKRFTYTLLVNASGAIVCSHMLFSNLKNPPKFANKNVLVDVNKTMWNTAITKSFIEKNMLTRAITAFYKLPVLLIIDSFGAHLKIASDYEKNNIFVVLVPPGLTGLLQPLGNRPFQQFYNDKYNDWLSRSIEDKTKRTKTGNLVTSSYLDVTN